MDEQQSAPDVELSVMQTVLEALEPLDARSQQRVFEYIATRLEISTARAPQRGSFTHGEEDGEQGQPGDGVGSSLREFATLAELQDAANPVLDKERVLVAAYWLQVCEGSGSVVSLAVNKALKDLGHGVSNVTAAFDALRRQKPALVLQLNKSGKSRQARKTYKVTNAGVTAVMEMIGG